MSKELLSKIEWTCKMKKVKPEIINGTLRIVEHTNLAYVEPHRVIIKEELYLFFNEQDYFYIDYISQTEKYIESVTNLRQKYRNKLRNCTDEKLIKEYKAKRDECTTMLNKYRKNLKIANYILEDTPKVKEI